MRTAAFATAFTYAGRRLTRLEIGIYSAVGAILFAVFADRALDYMEWAERTAMYTTLSVVASSVNARVAADMLQGSGSAAGRHSGRNPFALAGTTPPFFLGDLGSRELGSLERPAWVFDGQRGEVVYLPRIRRALRTEDPAGALRFRLVPHPSGLGYSLVPTSRYEWQVLP